MGTDTFELFSSYCHLLKIFPRTSVVEAFCPFVFLWHTCVCAQEHETASDHKYCWSYSISLSLRQVINSYLHRNKACCQFSSCFLKTCQKNTYKSNPFKVFWPRRIIFHFSVSVCLFMRAKKQKNFGYFVLLFMPKCWRNYILVIEKKNHRKTCLYIITKINKNRILIYQYT